MVLGSGVVLSDDGYIITNAHVVDGAERVRVVLHQPRGDDPLGDFLMGEAAQPLEARIIGTSSETDLALLKVEATGLKAIPLADYRRVRQGQLVFAFGSPEGLANSVTMGVVSAVARQPDPDSPTLYLQTDAPINPGNSGGPLVNAEGQLVGVSTFILSDSGGSQGLGFAIPSAVVAWVYPDLRTYGHLRRAVVGIEVQANSADYAAALNLPQSSGVLISDVLPASPAAMAGVQPGDIVAAVAGHPTPTVAQFGIDMAAHRPGDTVTMEILREKRRIPLTMVAIENTGTDPRTSARAEPGVHTVVRLGIIGIDVDDDVATQLPRLRERSGVLVVARDEKSPGVDDPLTSGDIIHCVNAYAVRSLDGLRAILDGFTPGARIAVQVERGARMRYVIVHLPK